MDTLSDYTETDYKMDFFSKGRVESLIKKNDQADYRDMNIEIHMGEAGIATGQVILRDGRYVLQSEYVEEKDFHRPADAMKYFRKEIAKKIRENGWITIEIDGKPTRICMEV